MAEEMSGRHAAVVAAVREMESAAKGRALLAVGATSRRLASALEVTETTALRYLRETIAAEWLVELEHAGRKLLVPWPEGTENPPDVWVNGEPKKGTFRVTEHREVGPAMARVRFVFTPERLKLLVTQVLAEAVWRAAVKQRADAAQEARYAAEDEAERKLFAQHYPLLAGMLTWYHEQLYVPRRSARGVRFHASEHPERGVRARVTIEVGDERFEVLEKILRDSLDDESKARVEAVLKQQTT
ncbi:hypothetical protein [Streptomyces sp. NPDC088789]|uniref:hypothetical protein n=1 Tax=Streptomyces sp. NPDC088789 TaxID=3365899 RepID=UPI00382F576B